MKTTILAFLSLAAVALGQDRIAVRLTDSSGNPIENGDVVAILKSGAYQDTKLENGEYVCKPTEQCVKIFAAASGHESEVKKFQGGAGNVAIALKPSPTKGSAIIRRNGALPGIEGYVSPILDNLNRLYLYTTKIGLELNGRPAQQPIKFVLKKPIDAVTSTGQKFKLWVTDITTQVSIVEYSLPK